MRNPMRNTPGMRRTHQCVIWSASVCLLPGGAFAQAKPVTQRDVQTAVETWLRQVIGEARPDGNVDLFDIDPFVILLAGP